MVNYLSPIARLDDVTSYANRMLDAKSDLTRFSAKEILLLDYKIYSFNEEKWGVGTCETCNMSMVLERQKDLLKEMHEEKKRGHLKGILFSVVDILNERNVTLIAGDYESKVVRDAFNVNIDNHRADLGSRISRKKQIIPTLEAYFKSKS